MKTLDLEALNVATPDVAAAVETFRKNFGFPVTREGGGRTALGIGAAEIEFRAEGDASGLHSIVLRVDSLEAAEKALAARGIAASRETVNGRAVLRVGPEATNGAPLVLVAG